jgi:O-antigen ligase
MRPPHRNIVLPGLSDPLPLLFGAGTVLLAAAAGAAAAGGIPRRPVLALAVIAGAAVLLSLSPEVFFVGWLLVAPLVQESASVHPVGHVLGLALYFGPSLVFALWTFTRSPARRPGVIDAFPALFCGYVLAALAISGEWSSVAVKGLYLTLGIGIVLYYFLAFGPIGSLSWEHVTGVVLAITAGEGVMSIIDSVLGWNLWYDHGWRAGEARSVATLANPAVLGAILGMGAVMAVAVLVWNGPKKLRTLAIVAIAAGLPGLYFTLTRAAIIGAIIGILLVLVSRPSTRVLAAACAIIAIVVLTISWGHITSSTVYRERIANSANVEVRFALERWSWRLFKEKPVLGWGYNAFDQAKTEAGLSAVDLARFGTVSASHNSYLTIAVDYGAAGLLLFVVPWVVILARAVRDAARKPAARWYLVGAVAALMVWVLANSAADFRYFSFLPAVAWALLGLLRREQLPEV